MKTYYPGHTDWNTTLAVGIKYYSLYIKRVCFTGAIMKIQWVLQKW